MTKDQPTGKLWMWSLITIISMFILFFASFAIWTFQDDVELVYDNYYDKDVVFEQQIRRVERTDALAIKPAVNYFSQREELTLKFSPAMAHLNPIGEVLLFRPADLHKDRLFPLDLIGDSLQTIKLPNMDRGLWRVKLSWTSKGLEYFYEQALMVK